ncbi:conserved hypothetical protein [Vibrio crassostreae]|nr:conserved hypothetical protein [Vibrio crassostreae]CAK2234044.1 conserved hypothetical protein [Vibrio crassostreae]CAK3738645.1 conserved hypothetical protein [Vibrio crassostreae]
MTNEEVRQAIDGSGWRQGSIISYSKLKEHIDEQELDNVITLPNPEKIKKPGSAFVVVINMSCDVVYGAVDQLPQIKCLLCWPKNGETSNSDLQDPRQFALQSEGQTLIFRMKDRLFVHKHALCNIKPDAQLTDEQVNSLVRWKVAQFNRLGLPEALATRIGDILNAPTFLDWVTEAAPKLEGIFLEIKPMSELKDDIPYEIGVIAVANSSTSNQSDVFDIAETIDTTLLEPLRNVSNIQLLNDSEQYEHEGQEAAVSSSEFSYDMLKRFRRFYLDHHSLDPESNSAPVGT